MEVDFNSFFVFFCGSSEITFEDTLYLNLYPW